MFSFIDRLRLLRKVSFTSFLPPLRRPAASCRRWGAGSSRSLLTALPVLAALSALAVVGGQTAALAAAGRTTPAEFTVEAPAGGPAFSLSSARGKFVALHFLLKTECPFCLKHTRDYAEKGAGLPGVVQVFLKPDSAEEIRSWSTKVNKGEAGAGVGVTIYRDAEARLAEAFGIPGGYRFHGQVVHYPALVLLDPEGREVFRYVGTNNVDRYPFDRFAATLAALREPAAALKEYNLGADRVALSGYDPVAYFTESRAVKGRKEFVAAHRGVTYQFSSDENRARFVSAPARYLPTYGGWCATAMAKGEKVEIDPTNFKVTNGRLFLFFKAFYANAIKDWNKDEAGLMSKADAHWKRIAGE